MKVVMMGAGNLATQLSIALVNSAVPVVQVWSRSRLSASTLAERIGCDWITDIGEIDKGADIYIVAVTDSAIQPFVESCSFGDKLVVHTAGSVPIDILANHCSNYGVFYPLQTFSKGRDIDFRNIPICLEANSEASLTKLRELAICLSDDVREINSRQRKQIHLAAVFVCNFVNHLYAIGERLVDDKQMDFSILKPLIAETASKATHFSPQTVQTGPAIRNNIAVMQSHIEMLVGYPGFQEIYRIISNDIYLTHNKLQ